MPLDEFAILRRYLARPDVAGAGMGPGTGLVLGIGDDCALLETRPECLLAISADTLVEGGHFPADSPPQQIAYRALAVAVSDLAACGATPAWFTLSLCMPAADPAWLEAFFAGLAEAAGEFGTALVGGDTLRGPLVLGFQVAGWVPRGQALRRDGAAAGDRIYVTGELGGALRGLEALQGGTVAPVRDLAGALERYWRPRPRLAAGEALRTLASAAIDISDGLVADLGHLAEASGLGATLELAGLPLAPGMERRQVEAATAGDDYELCFTAPPSRAEAIAVALDGCDLAFAEVGEMTPGSGVRCFLEGRELELPHPGYRHFDCAVESGEAIDRGEGGGKNEGEER